METIDELNHGKVGEALYVKFTLDKCKEYGFDKFVHIYDGKFLTLDDLDKIPNVDCSIPIYIDNTTKGRYECVCEFGVEVYQ